MSQLSGSIVFDATSIGEAVLEGLTPVLAQIGRDLRTLTGQLGATVLDEDVAVDVLLRHLPAATTSTQHPDAASVAGYLAEHLARAGFAVVAVTGPALEAEARRQGITAQPVSEAEKTLTQRDREDAWFAPGRTD